MNTERDDVRDTDWNAALAERLSRANTNVAPPAGLVDRIETRLRRDDARRRFATFGAISAAAAVVVAAIGVWSMSHSESFSATSPIEPAPTIASADQNSTTPLAAHVDPVHVTFTPESGLFARPIESKNPNITILFVYHNMNTQASDDGSGVAPEVEPSLSVVQAVETSPTTHSANERTQS